MAKIDLDATERGALAAIARPDGGSAPDRVVLRHILGLITHTRLLEAALGDAIDEIESHCRDYHHMTPKFMRDLWREILKKGAELP